MAIPTGFIEEVLINYDGFFEEVDLDTAFNNLREQDRERLIILKDDFGGSLPPLEVISRLEDLFNKREIIYVPGTYRKGSPAEARSIFLHPASGVFLFYEGNGKIAQYTENLKIRTHILSVEDVEANIRLENCKDLLKQGPLSKLVSAYDKWVSSHVSTSSSSSQTS